MHSARAVLLQALGHFLLGHSEPRDFADFLRQRVEANYFAAAVLMPEQAAVPFLSTAKDEVRWLGKAYDAIAKEFYIAAWFASKDWLTANPAVAKRLQTAVYDVARWSNANHDQTAVILSKYSKLGVDRVDAMTRAVYATSLSPNLMQPVLDIAARYNLIKQPIAARLLMAPTAS